MTALSTDSGFRLVRLGLVEIGAAPRFGRFEMMVAFGTPWGT